MSDVEELEDDVLMNHNADVHENEIACSSSSTSTSNSRVTDTITSRTARYLNRGEPVERVNVLRKVWQI